MSEDMVRRLMKMERILDLVEAKIEFLEGEATSFKRAFELLEVDPHSFSSRPCQTCMAVSTLIGRSYGCSKRAERQRT